MLRALALHHRDTLCVGRTHGIHAEPMVFGLKAALWYSEAGRNLERLKRDTDSGRAAASGDVAQAVAAKTGDANLKTLASDAKTGTVSFDPAASPFLLSLNETS